MHIICLTLLLSFVKKSECVNIHSYSSISILINFELSFEKSDILTKNSTRSQKLQLTQRQSEI